MKFILRKCLCGTIEAMDKTLPKPLTAYSSTQASAPKEGCFWDTLGVGPHVGQTEKRRAVNGGMGGEWQIGVFVALVSLTNEHVCGGARPVSCEAPSHPRASQALHAEISKRDKYWKTYLKPGPSHTRLHQHHGARGRERHPIRGHNSRIPGGIFQGNPLPKP